MPVPRERWYLEPDAHDALVSVRPRSRRAVLRFARAVASGRGTYHGPASARLLVRLGSASPLTGWSKRRALRLAALERLGEVAVPADACEAIRLSGAVHRVVVAPIEQKGPVFALGVMADRVREGGGTLERVDVEEALSELRDALRSGNTIVVWAAPPPFAALVSATTPVLPWELGLNPSIGCAVRPGPRRPVIDPHLCDRCGACVARCPTNRLVVTADAITIKRGCSGCGICEAFCPRAAIVMTVPGEDR